MICSVHGYYKKRSGRKMSNKIEALVFASSIEHAQELVGKMLSEFPVEIEYLNGAGLKRPLEEIYKERPELRGITPERGYIYNEYIQRDSIRRYVK